MAAWIELTGHKAEPWNMAYYQPAKGLTRRAAQAADLRLNGRVPIPDDIAAAQKFLVEAIGEFDTVFRTFQKGHEARALLEHLFEPPAVHFCAAFGQDVVRRFHEDGDHTDGCAGFVAHRQESRFIQTCSAVPLRCNVKCRSLNGYVIDLDRSRLEGAPAYSANDSGFWDDRTYRRRVDDYYSGPTTI